jgi:hypothetical protein
MDDKVTITISREIAENIAKEDYRTRAWDEVIHACEKALVPKFPRSDVEIVRYIAYGGSSWLYSDRAKRLVEWIDWAEEELNK